MSQDAQDTPAPTVTTPSRLQVVLLGYGKDGKREPAKDQHTLIRFPQTYEDAIAAVERNLAEHLPGGKADAMDIFNRMQNGDGEWVWAKAAREDWDLVREELLGNGQALGVGRAAPLPFVRGPLTIAHKASGALKWDIFGERYDMERPGSYAELPHELPPDMRERIIVKFFYFTSDQSKGPNTEAWAEFPESAYADEEVWRAVVPKPHQLLGFTMINK
ncbi:hypothetical protein BJ912DRAFT_1005014 [Pholiota molesta]|nr:hypothetical protein BJ912DRAFT_1005014 [Pholiota molesta]